MSLKHDNYISTAELAKFLGISVVAVFKRIKKGQIKATKIGRSYAIPHSYIQEEFPNYKIAPVDEGVYVSVMEAANILGISRVAVYKKIKNGQLEAKRVGRHFVISKDLVQKNIKKPALQSFKSTEKYLSVPEYAQLVGVSRVTIFKRIQQGSLQAHRVGRQYVIATSDKSDELIEQNEYLSVLQVAKKIGISRIAVFKRIKSGRLSAIKIGRSYAIHKSELNI